MRMEAELFGFFFSKAEFKNNLVITSANYRSRCFCPYDVKIEILKLKCKIFEFLQPRMFVYSLGEPPQGIDELKFAMGENDLNQLPGMPQKSILLTSFQHLFGQNCTKPSVFGK